MIDILEELQSESKLFKLYVSISTSFIVVMAVFVITIASIITALSFIAASLFIKILVLSMVIATVWLAIFLYKGMNYTEDEIEDSTKTEQVMETLYDD